MGAPLADFIGRKHALGIMGAVFMLGAALQEVPILSAMYAGRFLAGLAIGSTSMVRHETCPITLSATSSALFMGLISSWSSVVSPIPL